MLILEILGGLLILAFLVAVHELGHAIVAHRNGVVVEEYGLGFPPRAWKRKLKNGIIFSLNWLPIGGFVKLQGEHDAANKKGDYGAASFWQKTKILLAGVFINWIVAAILLTILALTGLPKIINNQFSVPSDTYQVSKPVIVTQVLPHDPAQRAGIEVGDKILAIDGHHITTANQLVSELKKHSGENIMVQYQRHNMIKSVSVSLKKAGAVVFGAAFGQQQFTRSTWSAPIVGVAVTGQYTWVTLQGLAGLVGNLFSGIVLHFNHSSHAQAQSSQDFSKVSQSVAGPVGILGTIFPEAERSGPTTLIFFVAIISLTLAVMNTLPIPSLDGGRWFVMAIFRLLRKPLTKKIEERIQATGFTILMGLFVLITIGDITKLFS